MYSNVLQSSGTLVVRGIIALIFGIAALFLPGPTLVGLVLAFGVFAFVDGILALAAAITRHDYEGRGWLAIEGLAGLAAGIVTFVRPGLTIVALIALFGAWALITGIMKIVLAIRLRKEVSGEWFLVLSGIASIVVAALVFATPAAATLALVWTIGIYAIVLGVLLLALSSRVRHWEKSA